jgi:excisionase family DNA binding protein
LNRHPSPAPTGEKAGIDVDGAKPDPRPFDRHRRRIRSATGAASQVFNTSEACEYLRISRPTFLKLIATGEIRAKKLGKGWKVLDTELERLLLAGDAS